MMKVFCFRLVFVGGVIIPIKVIDQCWVIGTGYIVIMEKAYWRRS